MQGHSLRARALSTFIFSLAAGAAHAACPVGTVYTDEGAFRNCGLLQEHCSACWEDADRNAFNIVLNATTQENTIYGEVAAVLENLELDINAQGGTPSNRMKDFNDAITVDAVCRSFVIDPDLITLDIEDELGDRFVQNCHLAWRVSRHRFATVLSDHVAHADIQFTSSGSATPVVNWLVKATETNGNVDAKNLFDAWTYSYDTNGETAVIEAWYNIDTRKIAREMIYENLTVESKITNYLNANCSTDPYKKCYVGSDPDAPYVGYLGGSPASIMKKHIENLFDSPPAGSSVAGLSAAERTSAKAAALARWDQLVDSASVHGYKSVASRMARKLRTAMFCGVKKIVNVSNTTANNTTANKNAVRNEINRGALLGANAYSSDGTPDNGAAYCTLIGLSF